MTNLNMLMEFPVDLSRGGGETQLWENDQVVVLNIVVLKSQC